MSDAVEAEALAPAPHSAADADGAAQRAAGRAAATRAPAARPTAVPLPSAAQFEPVGRCNLGCRMCAVNDRPDAGLLSLAQFDALLAQLPGLRELHLQGLGEPMLHPQFFAMVEHAVARGIRVSSNTNGTLLTPARARRCVSSGLDALSISLDGARAATYESIRVGGNFAKVLRNIERVVRARRELASATPRLRLVMVLMKRNLEELPAMVELAAALGVGELLVQRLASELNEPTLPPRYLPIRRYVSDAELRGIDLADAAEVFAAARERAARLHVTLHLPKLLPTPRWVQPAPSGGGRRVGAVDRALGHPAQPGAVDGALGHPAQPGAQGQEQRANARCSWPFDKLYVTAGGELLPCCMVGTPDRASFGNALADGVAAVWNGAAARQWRQALGSDDPGPLCRGCALYRGTF